MDVTNTPLGPEGKMSIKVEGGKLIISIEHTHASGSLKLEASEDLKYFLEQLKPKLPTWASVAVNVAEAALP